MASNLSHGMKRVVSGVLALLIVAGSTGLPANVGTGGLFGKSAITAKADTTTHTGQSINLSDLWENQTRYDPFVNFSEKKYKIAKSFYEEAHDKITIANEISEELDESSGMELK